MQLDQLLIIQRNLKSKNRANYNSMSTHIHWTFYLRHIHITVDLQSYGSRLTDEQEQYDLMTEKNGRVHPYQVVFLSYLR